MGLREGRRGGAGAVDTLGDHRLSIATKPSSWIALQAGVSDQDHSATLFEFDAVVTSTETIFNSDLLFLPTGKLQVYARETKGLLRFVNRHCVSLLFGFCLREITANHQIFVETGPYNNDTSTFLLISFITQSESATLSQKFDPRQFPKCSVQSDM